MKLDIRLTHRFLDQLWCQAIVVFLFEDDFLQKEYLSKINKTLASSLTPLLDTQFITGKRGELTLIAPQDRIKAEKLLFVGLGTVSGYSARILPALTRNLSFSLDRLHINEFCIMVPRFEGKKKQCETFVKSMILGTMSHYENSRKDVVDFTLKILVSIDRELLSNMQSLQQNLKGYLDSHMENTIIIDESRGLHNDEI
jgi:hypothetical protein